MEQWEHIIDVGWLFDACWATVSIVGRSHPHAHDVLSASDVSRATSDAVVELQNRTPVSSLWMSLLVSCGDNDSFD